MGGFLYIELITSFVIGVALIALSAWLLRIKAKPLLALIINAILGTIILISLNLFGIMTLPINPINILITGYLGIFGVVLIYLIVVFL